MNSNDPDQWDEYEDKIQQAAPSWMERMSFRYPMLSNVVCVIVGFVIGALVF